MLEVIEKAEYPALIRIRVTKGLLSGKVGTIQSWSVRVYAFVKLDDEESVKELTASTLAFIDE